MSRQIDTHIEELRGAFHGAPDEDRLEAILARIDALDTLGDPEQVADKILPYLQGGLAEWARRFEQENLREKDFDSEDRGSLAQRVVALESTMRGWDVHEGDYPAVQEFMAQPAMSRIQGECDEVFSRVRFEVDYRVLILRTVGRERMHDVRIPPVLHAYNTAMQGRWWTRDYSNPYALKMYWSQGMVSSSVYMAKSFSDESGYKGPWLNIGDWSDKHDIMLCCDSRSELFGQVHDFYDDHPWLDGEHDGDIEAEDFAQYISMLARLPES